MLIFIDDEYLNEIKFVMAYPSEDKIILTDEQIKSFCVWPAMQEYFIKFPLPTYYSCFINGEIEVDFESDVTYSALDIRVVDSGVSYPSGDSFWELVKFQQMGGISFGGRGSYGIPGYTPNGLQQQMLEKINLQKTIQKTYSTLKYRVNVPKRKVVVYSTATGTLNITWANYSTDFDDIKFTLQRDVIKLAQANLLDHLANTVGMITDNTLDVTIDASTLKTNAEELRSGVKEKWDQYPDIIVLHN